MAVQTGTESMNSNFLALVLFLSCLDAWELICRLVAIGKQTNEVTFNSVLLQIREGHQSGEQMSCEQSFRICSSEGSQSISQICFPSQIRLFGRMSQWRIFSCEGQLDFDVRQSKLCVEWAGELLSKSA